MPVSRSMAKAMAKAPTGEKPPPLESFINDPEANFGFRKGSFLLRDLKRTTRTVIREVLDIDKTYRDQPAKNIEELKSQIRRTFPSLFLEPTISAFVRDRRMAITLQYASKAFGCLRCQHLKNAREGSPKTSERSVEDTQPSQANRQPSQRRSTRRSAIGESSFATTMSQSTPTPTLSGTAPPTATAPTSSISTWEPMPDNAIRIKDIQQFLESCEPSMIHLVDSFIQSGCKNHDSLHAIAKWAPLELDHFLLSLRSPYELGRLNMLEFMTLRRQFDLGFRRPGQH